MSVIQFSPTFGSIEGGTEIIIIGYDFTNLTTVTIGGISAVVIFKSDTYIIAITPKGSIGEKEVVVDGETLCMTFMYIVITPPPYCDICVNPPYNATNFTSGPILSTLQSYANSPNYPLNTGSDASQIYISQQNISYFNGINQQRNGACPQFRSEAERMMYIQGRALMSSRNKLSCTPQ